MRERWECEGERREAREANERRGMAIEPRVRERERKERGKEPGRAVESARETGERDRSIKKQSALSPWVASAAY